MTLPDVDGTEGVTLVRLSARVSDSVRLVVDDVDAPDALLTLLCAGFAVQAVAGLSDGDVQRRVTEATGAAAARRFALGTALQHERTLELRRAGLRGLAEGMSRWRGRR